MKNLLIIGLLIIAVSAAAQSPGELLALKIATRMKDSLVLADSMYRQIYDINLQLHYQKQPLFNRYKGTDSLRIHLQRIEDTRDSLYSTVLPPDKYLLYKEKKVALVRN